MKSLQASASMRNNMSFAISRLSAWMRDRRAVAALEFAIVAPVVAAFLAAAADYGLAMWSRSCLTNAVAQGAYYAFLTGTSVTPATVQTMVANVSSLGALGVTVTATASDPTLCYCPTGTPASLGPALANCTVQCSGLTAGNYMTISASAPLKTFMPLMSLLSGKQISDTAVVRLK
jgi:Flp pilus assembly protein TadG